MTACSACFLQLLKSLYKHRTELSSLVSFTFFCKMSLQQNIENDHQSYTWCLCPIFPYHSTQLSFLNYLSKNSECIHTIDLRSSSDHSNFYIVTTPDSNIVRKVNKWKYRMLHEKAAPELVGVIGPAPYTLDPLELVVFKMDELVLVDWNWHAP